MQSIVYDRRLDGAKRAWVCRAGEPLGNCWVTAKTPKRDPPKWFTIVPPSGHGSPPPLIWRHRSSSSSSGSSSYGSISVVNFRGAAVAARFLLFLSIFLFYFFFLFCFSFRSVCILYCDVCRIGHNWPRWRRDRETESGREGEKEREILRRLVLSWLGTLKFQDSQVEVINNQHGSHFRELKRKISPLFIHHQSVVNSWANAFLFIFFPLRCWYHATAGQ